MRRVRYLTGGSKQVLSIDGQTVIQVVPKGQRVGKSAVERTVLAPGEPRQVATVRRIFNEFNAGGTARTIAHGLNSDDISSPRGKTWGRNMVARILGNPAYCGMHAWNRHSWAKFHVVGEDG
ncbi:MAG: hypothetical protein GY851_00545, partial [bacterium]|nr:hypothetical protein [bacterium]